MEFDSAGTLAVALERLAADGDELRILAGGTDLVLQQQRGEIASGALLYIGRIDELHRIALTDGVARIGSLVSHSRLQSEPLVAGNFPALAEAAASVGGWQTQAVGTVGGNVCNASPAADTIPPLLIADTRIELRSTRGTRTVLLEDFILGRRSIDRRSDELVTALELPMPVAHSGEVYLKVAPRGAMEVALVGLAVRLTLDIDGAVSGARVAIAAVGPRPVRVRSVEKILSEGVPDPDALEAAGEMLARETSPIDDVRATANYRRRILPALLKRAVGICQERARAA